MGVRGWLTALDEGSGKIVWKAYHTGPDKDVLIGPRFQPFYATDRGKDLGVQDLARRSLEDRRRHASGAGSATIPRLKLIFYGTGNPGRGTRTSGRATTNGRPASSRATSTPAQARLVLPDSPHDLYDHDDVNEIILLDMPWGNGRRPGAGPARPQRLHLRASTARPARCCRPTPYGYINVYKGVDLKTGRLIPTPTRSRKQGRVTRDICPAAPGAKDWNPSAFSPRHRPALHPAHQSVHGRRAHARRTTSPARPMSAPT